MRLVETEDGSHTVFNPVIKQHYHSTHGAVQESRHIFIETGLYPAFDKFPATGLSILEIGFGTGLNALLTLIEAEKHKTPIDYTAIEVFPLGAEIWNFLNYPTLLGSVDYSTNFEKLHLARWEMKEAMSAFFTLEKINLSLLDYIPSRSDFHLVYFDAFSPEAQPELWTEELFLKIFKNLVPGGFVVTYSVKGTVVRALRSAGFNVHKLAGPPGKRHILQAMKPIS